MDAQEALRIGMVNEVVSPGRADANCASPGSPNRAGPRAVHPDEQGRFHGISLSGVRGLQCHGPQRPAGVGVVAAGLTVRSESDFSRRSAREACAPPDERDGDPSSPSRSARSPRQPGQHQHDGRQRTHHRGNPGRTGGCDCAGPAALAERAQRGHHARNVVRSAVELDRDEGIGAILITGAGRAFAAGADIGEMRDKDHDVLLPVRLVRGVGSVRRPTHPRRRGGQRLCARGRPRGSDDV